MMHRPPNQAEATALAYWAAKQYSIISYAYPVGIAAGLWRTYGTRKTWKFPFLKPDLTKFNPDVFPTEKIKLFSGQRARAAWNGIRLTAYTSGFVFAAQILFASYGMSVVAVGEQTDKRLNEYIEAVKKTAGQAHTAMQQRRGQQLPPPVPGPGGQQQQQPYGFGVPPVAAQKQQEEYDDASPTGGKAFWEENDNDLAEKGWKSETDPSRERFESRVERDSEKRRRRMGGDINAGTSGVSDSSAYSEENSDPSSGSAWERLRRQNGPSGGSQYGDRND